MAKPIVLKEISELKKAIAEFRGGKQISTKLVAERGVQKGLGVTLNDVGKVIPAASEATIPRLVDNSGTTLSHTQGSFGFKNTIEVSPGKILLVMGSTYNIEAYVLDIDVVSTLNMTRLSISPSNSGTIKLFKVRPNKFIYFNILISSRDNAAGDTIYTKTFQYGLIEVNGNQCNVAHRGNVGYSAGGNWGLHDPSLLQLNDSEFLMLFQDQYIVFRFVEGTGTLEISKSNAMLPALPNYASNNAADAQSHSQRVGNFVFYTHNSYNANLYSFSIDGNFTLTNPMTYPLGIGNLSGFQKIDENRFLAYSTDAPSKSSRIVMVTTTTAGAVTISPALNIGAFVKSVFVSGKAIYLLTVQGVNVSVYLVEAGNNKLTLIEASLLQPELPTSDNVNGANYHISAKGDRLCVVKFNNVANGWTTTLSAFISEPFTVDADLLGFADETKNAGEEVTVAIDGVLEGLSGLEANKYYKTVNGVLVKQARKNFEGKSVALALSSTKLLIL